MSAIEWAPIRIPIERRLQVIQPTMLLFLHDFFKIKMSHRNKSFYIAYFSKITDTSRSVLDIHIYTVEHCWYRIISLCVVLLINIQMDTYFVYGLGSIRLENTRARRSKMEVHVRHIHITDY